MSWDVGSSSNLTIPSEFSMIDYYVNKSVGVMPSTKRIKERWITFCEMRCCISKVPLEMSTPR